MTINEVQDTIIEEFSLFDDWMDKYAYLIELGKGLLPYDVKHKTDQYLIKGCQSRVWIYAEERNGVIWFTADSDAIITKGIISLLIKVYSGQTAEAILGADLYFIDKIGLKENLSPTRANGLVSMIQQIKLYALAFNLAARREQGEQEGGD